MISLTFEEAQTIIANAILIIIAAYACVRSDTHMHTRMRSNPEQQSLIIIWWIDELMSYRIDCWTQKIGSVGHVICTADNFQSVITRDYNSEGTHSAQQTLTHTHTSLSHSVLSQRSIFAALFIS